MFERFTDRARKATTLAQENARRLGHNYIGTEHLLLGLIEEGSGVAARALESLGIELEPCRFQIEQIIGPAVDAPRKKHIPFTPRAKKVMELSLREALQMGHNYIGTEHILLGLLREGQGIAAQVIVSRGVTLEEARTTVVQLLQGVAPAQAVGQSATFQRAQTSFARTATVPAPGRPASCPHCLSALEANAAYTILTVPEENGDGLARVLFVYCRSCGRTLDSLIAPEDS